MDKLQIAFLFFLTLLFYGCASQHKIDSKPIEGQVPKAGISSIDKENQGISHLRKLASEAVEAEDYNKAIALLERALRMAPYRAQTYLELAKVRSAIGDTTQALMFAERGLLYCENIVCSALKTFIKEKKSIQLSR